MKISKIKFKKIKSFFKKLPKTLGEKSFLTFLLFLSIALFFGGLIFYRYVVLIKKANPEILERPFRFDQKTYQILLDFWQEKEKTFQWADLKEYPDLFRVD